MILISAMSKNRVIGSGDGMPWNVPEEFRQFQSFIDGQTIIAGRRSWEIFRADLTSAHNIVISRSRSEVPEAIVCNSVDEAVEKANAFGCEIFCIGGASIYRLCLPLATAMYLSFIKGEYSGDAYFPEFSASDWEVTRHEDHPRFEFRVYHRKS